MKKIRAAEILNKLKFIGSDSKMIDEAEHFVTKNTSVKRVDTLVEY